MWPATIYGSAFRASAIARRHRRGPCQRRQQMWRRAPFGYPLRCCWPGLPRAGGDRVRGTQMPNTTVLLAAMRCEWRILRRDPALWLVLAMIFATFVYALHNGKTVVERQPAAVAAAKAEEQERLADHRNTLGEIESGKAEAPEAPFRD